MQYRGCWLLERICTLANQFDSSWSSLNTMLGVLVQIVIISSKMLALQHRPQAAPGHNWRLIDAMQVLSEVLVPNS